MNFDVGELVIIEVALSKFGQDIEVGTTAGQSIMSIIGKCEYSIAEISKAVQKQTPGGLRPPDPPSDKK